MFNPARQSLKFPEDEQIKLPLNNCSHCPICPRRAPKDGSFAHTYKGYPDADFFFLGEGLGAEEDAKKECFVGTVGQELHRWIPKSGIKIEECFFDNVVKCRPPGNRTPEEEEVTACWDNLEATIEAVSPKAIIVLGNPAMDRILGIPSGVTNKAGKIFSSDRYDCLVMPLSHPSHVMQYAQEDRTKYINYLKLLRDVVRGEVKKEELDYEVLDTWPKIQSFIKKQWPKISKYSFDSEATGVKVWSEMLGVGFSWARCKAVYIPLKRVVLGHNPKVAKQRMFDVGEESIEEIYEQKGLEAYVKFIKKRADDVRIIPFWNGKQENVKDILRMMLKSDKRKCAQNAKFDGKMCFHSLNVYPPNLDVDPMLMHSLTNSGEAHSLDELVMNYPSMVGYDREVKLITGGTGKKYWLVPYPILGKYCCGDCDITYRLSEDLLGQLTKKQRWLYKNLYIGMNRVYARTECLGFNFDMEFSKKMEAKYLPKVQVVEELFEKSYGINPASNDEISEYLMDNNAPVDKKTKTGLSTDKQVMRDLIYSDSVDPDLKVFCQAVLDYRGFSKMLSTYILGVRDEVSPQGRIHPSFFLDIVRTGRLSSRNPNMQNFPVRPIKFMIQNKLTSFEVSEVRGVVTPEPGMWWVGIDFKTLEVMIMAFLSKDKALIEACRGDVHNHAASWIHGISVDEVTKSQRRAAKEFVFGGFYGAGPQGLTNAINKSMEDPSKKVGVQSVSKNLQKLLRAAPRSQTWIKELLAQVRKKGYIETPFGRRRPLPNINSSDRLKRGQAERMAVNTDIQSVASDIVQFAFWQVYDHFKRNGWLQKIGWPQFTIHDELIMSVYPDQLEKCLEEVTRIMTTDNIGVQELGIDFLSVDHKIHKTRWGFVDD